MDFTNRAFRYIQGLPTSPDPPRATSATPSPSPEDVSRQLFSPAPRQLRSTVLPVSSITTQPSPQPDFFTPQTRRIERRVAAERLTPESTTIPLNSFEQATINSMDYLGQGMNIINANLRVINRQIKNIRPPAQTGGRNPPQYLVTSTPREIQPSVNIATAEPPIHVSRREIKNIDKTASSDFGYVPRKEDYLDSCMKANTFIDLDNRYLLYKQNNMQSTPALPTMRMYASGFDVVPNITPQLGNGYLQGGYQDIRNNVLDRTAPPYIYYDRTFSGIGSER